MKGKRSDDRPGTHEPAETPAADTAPSDTTAAAAAIAPANAPANAPAHVPNISGQVVTETIKHDYTVAELAEMADLMGRAAAQVFHVEREKSEATARYGAELKAANLAHGALVEKFNLRYETLDVRCRVEYDRPEVGYKAHVREDTDEVV